jgi:hypothetical protein
LGWKIAFIDNLTVDNFVETLEMMEPLLLNECVGPECDVHLDRLRSKCQEIGKELPEGYAPTHH